MGCGKKLTGRGIVKFDIRGSGAGELFGGGAVELVEVEERGMVGVD